jgi:D-aminopeptidase
VELPRVGGVPRVREVLELSTWTLRPGPRNSIADVEGVRVGHVTLYEGSGPLVPGRGPVRTGVTVVLPHGGNVYREKVPAAAVVFNGFTKAVGLVQVEELGVLETPIALTNTLNVGLVADGLVEHSIRVAPEIGVTAPTVNPVVLECNDGYLNDIQGRHVRQHHVLEAIARASEDFEEGSVGAGTGTVAFGFKGGVGTSSRVVETPYGRYVVGVLVQTNFGRAEDLLIGGVPVGRLLRSASPVRPGGGGSVNVVIATNAPLTSRQLRRLARRAQVGLARVGGYVYHGSGEVALAFSTAYRVTYSSAAKVEVLPDTELNAFFRAVAEAVEEAVLDSMFTARTVEGRDGRVVQRIPVEEVLGILRRYGGGWVTVR